jgi:homoserine dehydrogenase
VFKHLKERDDLFEVGPVLVRHPERHREDAIFVTDPAVALGFCPDIVIECIGGNDLAVDLMRAAMLRGAYVVSANKSALSARWDALSKAASSGNAMLYYSAAVGGGVPILETLDRLRGQVVAIEGVMNGTCNYLLSRMGEGVGFEEALEEARELGFAEADASSDLDGHDAAFKLLILARHAFGASLAEGNVNRETLRSVTSEDVVRIERDGHRPKQVGRCSLQDGEVRAEVRLEVVPPDHPFFGVTNEQNCFVVTLQSGEVIRLDGKGAGRWPTAAAVFSDVMDAQRELHRRSDAAAIFGQEA